MTASPLVVEGITKSFGGTTVLDLDRLETRAGEVHALVGQNGSGKSTVIKILAGFYEPDDYRSAQAGGQDVTLGDPSTPHKAGWRFVHQDLGLVSSLSTIDNLALGVGYPSSMGRIKWRDARRRAQAAIERLGYDFDVREPTGKLAPVQRTAVAVARALTDDGQQTTLLVLDEPTATMPKSEVNQLLDLMRAVAANGTAVLFVSHHLDEVMSSADVATVLRDGKVVERLTVAETDHRALIQAMTGGLITDVRAERVVDVDRRDVLTVRGLTGAVVRDLDLGVRSGEVVGVAGITGSGREELSGLLFGAQPRDGVVSVNGDTLAANSPRRAIAAGVSFVPANRIEDGIIPNLSVRENMTLPDVMSHWKRARLNHRDERREVDELRTRFQIKGARDESPINYLSGGNQQKASIAKWMRMNPSVLLLDDPTQGVDVAAQAEIHRLIIEAAAEGMAVLVASSDEAELATICSTVHVMRRGRIATTLDGDDINAPTIINASLAERSESEEGPR